MAAVVFVLIGLAAVMVVAIAFVAVGQETVNLADSPRRAFFDIDEATNFVADRLPEPVAARLSYADVELLVRWHLTYFRERGIASFGGIDHAAQEAAQAGVVVVADEDEAVDELLARAQASIDDCTAEDVVCVTDLTNAYLVEIGAVGRPVEAEEVQALAAGQALAALDAGTLEDEHPLRLPADEGDYRPGFRMDIDGEEHGGYHAGLDVDDQRPSGWVGRIADDMEAQAEAEAGADQEESPGQRPDPGPG